jgi:hypothetical protein
MHPTVISEPSLLVPAHVAATLGPLITAVMNEARRDRLDLPADVVETLDKIQLVGDAYRNRVTPTKGAVAPEPFDPPSWTAVKDASDILKISPQAVTGLCRSGSLHAEQDGRLWRVCSESVTTRRVGTTCQHTTQETTA